MEPAGKKKEGDSKMVAPIQDPGNHQAANRAPGEVLLGDLVLSWVFFFLFNDYSQNPKVHMDKISKARKSYFFVAAPIIPKAT